MVGFGQWAKKSIINRITWKEYLWTPETSGQAVSKICIEIQAYFPDLICTSLPDLVIKSYS